MRKIRENRNVIKIKFAIILVLAVLFAISLLYANKIEEALGLKCNLNSSQTTSSSLNDAPFKVNYIDVGQGNATFIEFPDGKTMLIDGGNTMYGKTVYEYITNAGYSQIDYLVASHADADHIGGLNYVLENLEVKNIYRPFQISMVTTESGKAVYKDEDLAEIYNYLIEITNNRSKISTVTTSLYQKFITNIYRETYTESGISKSAPVMVFYDGLVISGENYVVEFFSPLVREGDYNLLDYSNTLGYATEGYGSTNSNDNSAIMLVEIYDYSFLFTGDASWTESGASETNTNFEELDFVNSLTALERLRMSKISVYLVGHHGSAYSSSVNLLSLITPHFAVISVSENNTYGHPTSSTLSRLATYCTSEPDYLLMTKDNGDIVFAEVDGKLMYVVEYETNSQSITISWYVLGSVIFVLLTIVVIVIKPQKRRK